jgi:hypothetical protein
MREECQPRVQTLKVYAVRDFTDAALTTVVDSLSGLRNLTLGSCDQLTPNGILELRKLKYLESLELDGVTDSFAESVTKIETLRRVTLRWSQLTDLGLKHLASMSELEKISLTECKTLTDAGLLPLSALPKLKHLRLYGGFTNGTDSPGGGLEATIKSCPLVSFSLSSCPIVSDGALFALASKQLTSFGLHGCEGLPVSGTAVNAVIRGCCVLGEVELETAPINDETVMLFAELPQLRRLLLRVVHSVTAQGWMMLAKAPSLEKLHLEQCSGLTDSCLRVIAGIPSLQELKVFDCYKVTEAAVKEIQAEKSKLVGCGTFRLEKADSWPPILE